MIKEMEGDTCKACEYRILKRESCPTCNRVYEWSTPMPYCKKNDIWLIDTLMVPCPYFKRGRYWYFEINLNLTKNGVSE